LIFKGFLVHIFSQMLVRDETKRGGSGILCDNLIRAHLRGCLARWAIEAPPPTSQLHREINRSYK
jgi:hypothetical protein